jgi:hypothetical protein
MPPAFRDHAAGHGEERERRVAAVPDQMHVEGIGKQALEQPQILHVERGLVAPALLPVLGRIRLEDRRDRGAGRHAGSQAAVDGIERHAPLEEAGQPLQVGRERRRVDGSRMPARQLRDEVRLVRYRERRVAVEHHPEERRARAPHAEHDHRRVGAGHRGSLGVPYVAKIELGYRFTGRRFVSTPPRCSSQIGR